MVCKELPAQFPTFKNKNRRKKYFFCGLKKCMHHTRFTDSVLICFKGDIFFNFLLPKTPLQNITRVLFLGKVSGWQADYQGLVFYSTICSHCCQQTAKNRLLSHQSTRRKLALIHFALLFSCSAQWTQTKKKKKSWMDNQGSQCGGNTNAVTSMWLPSTAG